MALQIQERQFKVKTIGEKNASHHRTPYQKITNELRQQLITEICNEGQTIRKTAEQYGLKYSTVKGIVQIYLAYGRQSKKEKRNRKYYLKQNQQVVSIDLNSGEINIYHQQAYSRVVIAQENQQEGLESEKILNQIFQCDTECLEELIKKEIRSASVLVYHVVGDLYKKQQNQLNDKQFKKIQHLKCDSPSNKQNIKVQQIKEEIKIKQEQYNNVSKLKNAQGRSQIQTKIEYDLSLKIENQNQFLLTFNELKQKLQNQYEIMNAYDDQ